MKRSLACLFFFTPSSLSKFREYQKLFCLIRLPPTAPPLSTWTLSSPPSFLVAVPLCSLKICSCDWKLSPVQTLFISCMFHITGIFPLCILLTHPPLTAAATDKMLSSFQKRQLSLRGAHSDRMSAVNNRPIECRSRWVRWWGREHTAEAHPSQQAEPPAVGALTTACFRTGYE